MIGDTQSMKRPMRHISVDEDIDQWLKKTFKAVGPLVNKLLREYMEEEEGKK